jgi:hypothetical protein
MTSSVWKRALYTCLDICVGWRPIQTVSFACGCITTISQNHAGTKLRFDTYPASHCRSDMSYLVKALHAPTTGTDYDETGQAESASAGSFINGTSDVRH